METPLPLPPVSTAEARSLLDEVGRIQSGTRARLRNECWRWMLVWAVLSFGAALSAVPPFTPAAGWYWTVAVPLGLLATVVLDVRSLRTAGVRRRDWPYWVVGTAIALLSFGGSMVLPPEAMAVWVWIVFGSGFIAFMALEREQWAVRLLAWVVGATAAAGLVVTDRFGLYPFLGVAHGSALAVIALRIRQRAAAP
jgi:hypothetical protein